MNEKVKQFINDKIRALTSDVQLYKYVEKDEMQAEITSLELENVKNVLGALDNMEELIKGKDEYIAKLCNDRAELKEKIKRLDSQYKNIHNTKVKVPLCNIFGGLPQHERYKIIEDIYYSHTEQVEKLQNQNMELEEKYCRQQDLKSLLKLLSGKM